MLTKAELKTFLYVLQALAAKLKALHEGAS